MVVVVIRGFFLFFVVSVFFNFVSIFIVRSSTFLLAMIFSQ